MLAGVLKPDDETIEMPRLNVSYKPQTIAPKFEGTVKDLLYTKLSTAWESALFKTEVLVPLDIESLLDNEVQTLSGGELQRTAIVLALAKPCDIYLIDEPSAYLDSEQRVRASKVMKRWIMNSKRSAFIVEHDFIMATYLADKVIVFDGIPAKEAYCTSPEGLVSGMNKFLKLMDITFRRDPTNFRPRINKLNSQKDQEQKGAGNYFLMEGQLEEEEKEGKKLKASKSAIATKGEPVSAEDNKLKESKSADATKGESASAEDKIQAKGGEGAAESHVKGGKGDKGEKKSKKDKE